MTASIKWVVLALLIFDGLLTVALEVLFLPTYIGGWPFPLSAVVAAVVNVLLVIGARAVTDRRVKRACRWRRGGWASWLPSSVVQAVT